MTGTRLDETLDVWIDALDGYSYKELCMQPAPGHWSIGQVYQHLLSETNYYAGQVASCIKTDQNRDREPTTDGKTMLSNNCLPAIKIEGGPNHDQVPMPLGKEPLRQEFLKLKKTLNNLETAVKAAEFHGKSQHPGLGFFNASEWLQFAEMHLRHHLWQKQRIDQFLRGNASFPAN